MRLVAASGEASDDILSIPAFFCYGLSISTRRRESPLSSPSGTRAMFPSNFVGEFRN